MKILLLILGLAGFGNCGDAEISGLDLGGLYDGNFLPAGGGDFEKLKEVDESYKVQPLLGPPVDVGYNDAFPPLHFRGHGHHPFLGPNQLVPRPPPVGYGRFRHPVLHDDIDAWRPIIKPFIPVLKNVVAKPIHFPRPFYKHEVPIGRPPIVKAGVEHAHVGDYDHSYPAHGYGAGAHQNAYPPIYKPVIPIPLYKPTPFSIDPSLSYGYSYKLVPTFAYGPAILDDHLPVGYPQAHGYRQHGPAQAHF